MAFKSVKWDVTGRCNLRCAHCSVGKSYFAGEIKEIPLEQKLEIVDKLAEGGVKILSLLGGEPLVMKEDFFSVIERAVSRGLKISLVTNGILLDGRVMERVVESGIERIVVSLEGASKETHEFVRGKDTFKKVIDNMAKLTSYIEKRAVPLQVSVNTVLTRSNYPEIDELIDLCIRLRVNEWTLLSLGAVGFAEDNLGSLEISPEEEIDAAKKVAQRCSSDEGTDRLSISPLFAYPLICDYIQEEYGLKMPKPRICCNASIGLGFIGPDGNLYPCDRVAAEHYVGCNIGDAEIRRMSLVDHSFYEIWNSDYYLNMFELILNDDTYKDYIPCNHCKYLKTRYCNPCPLYSLDSKVAIKTCQIAEKRLGDISAPDGEISFVNDILTSESWPQDEEKSRSENLFGRIIRNIPVKKWGVRSFEKGEFLILLNPCRVEFVGLNLIGKVIWELIDGRNTVQEIASEINSVAAEIKNRVSPGASGRELQALLNRKTSLFFETLDHMGLIAWLSEDGSAGKGIKDAH
jgi:MoaA/NifB/PqqE/SkfB family radical SAM enzyme